ncbi:MULTISPECIES: hypothetical protein [Haloarcula]|uniref:phage NrS-1 polymerase family protein n=1 Tax=Haloarcula TaxID=2237 RepID=UPI000F8C7038|nr:MULTISPECIES: hypothetical protein [Haloarcula]NHX41412.1 hypothetical protein [Haloarcula sp. R1-2]
MSTKTTADETDEEMCEHLDDSPSTEMHPVIEEGRFKIPESLRERELFIVYRIETDEDGEESKVPYAPNMQFYKTDPTTEEGAVTFEEAMDVVQKSKRPNSPSYDGIGLVCSDENRLAGFDLDDCVDLESGSIAEFALQIVWTLPGGFVELSPSGTGLHIYFFTDGLVDGCANKVPVGDGMDLELYEEDRYLTVTGRTLKGFSTEITECGPEAREIQKKWMESGEDEDSSGSSSSGGRRKNTSTKKLNWDPGQSSPEAKKPMTDEDRELIETACEADDEFAKLWNDDGHGCSDASVADFKLASKLAYWTAENIGKYYQSDIDAMERMIRASHLSRRKFDKDSGDYCYIRLTCAKAIQASDGGIIPEDR